MERLDIIRSTAVAIDGALVTADSVRVKDVEQFSSGINMGARLFVDAQESALTLSELFDCITASDENWSERPDFVLGALAGVLSVTLEFNEPNNGVSNV